MHLAPPPIARDLLPPILACLPTSFASPRPPPALLPLLSPLLRQRVSYLSGTTGNDGWLPLLSWDAHRGAKLPAAAERMDLEPHPVSGELELEEVRPAKFRRLDQETLHARLEVEQFGLLPIYVWCEKDEHGGTDPGWKLAELRTLDDLDDDTEWFESISEANDATDTHAAPAAPPEGETDDANDDYWNAYDRTPADRTPSQHTLAPNPNPNLATSSATRKLTEEDEYYARYGQEVQPAMDSHDPDEDQGHVGESTLTGSTMLQPEARLPDPPNTSIAQQANYLDTLRPSAAWGLSTNGDRKEDLSMPRPISPASSQSSIDKLEEQAAAMSTGANDRAQLAIKQHISTDIKSLFRLAKASGMGNAEFSAVVRRELEVLHLLDDE